METHQRHTQPRGVRVTHDLRGEVQDLLDQLARAATKGDGEAVAALWEPPALVISAERVIAVRSRIEIAQFLHAARDQYTARGIVDTRADLLDLDRIGDRIVVATVKWPHLDARARELGAETADYTLRRDDSGKLKVCSVLVRGAS